MKIRVSTRVLWSVVVILVIVASFGLAMAFVEYSSSSSAQDSSVALKEYLDATLSEAEKISASGSAVVAIEKAKQPSFKEVAFGDYYKDYRDAKQRHDDILNDVNLLFVSFDRYVNAMKFEDEYQNKLAELDALAATIAPELKSKDLDYLNSQYALVKDLNSLIEGAVAASEDSETLTELGRVSNSMVLNSEGIIFSVEVGGDAAFDYSYEQYYAAKSQLPRVEKYPKDYADAMKSEVDTRIEKLKAHRNALN